MIREITVMSAAEVIGNLTPILEKEYPGLYKQLKNNIDSKLTIDEILFQYYMNEINNENYFDFRLLNEEETFFLHLPADKYWYIDTFANSYIKNL